jgi:hypothetical protein
MRSITRVFRVFALTATTTLALASSLVPSLPTGLGTSTAAAAESRVPVDRKKTAEHLVKHQTYPATRAELLASCNNLVDFSDGEKQWFAAHLPEGTYPSADAVLAVLFRK